MNGWAVVSFLVKGGPVMVPLLLCSLTALAVTIERLLCWRSLGDRWNAEQVLGLVGQGELAEAEALASASPHPLGRVLAAGLRHRNPSPGAAMQAAALAELPRLRRYLPVLDTIVTMAPLLGLLGTVTGMIGAFGIMAESGINQPHAVTGGVGEALIATATGLLIAIATLLPYNYFTARADREAEAMEQYATRLEVLLQATAEA